MPLRSIIKVDLVGNQGAHPIPPIWEQIETSLRRFPSIGSAQSTHWSEENKLSRALC